MILDLDRLRYLAASKTSLCVGHHEIHRSDDGAQVWATCDGGELDRMQLAHTATDLSDDVRRFLTVTMAHHETDVADAIVIELLNRLEIAQAEIRDGLSWMEGLVRETADPGTGALAWIHRNREV